MVNLTKLIMNPQHYEKVLNICRLSRDILDREVQKHGSEGPARARTACEELWIEEFPPSLKQPLDLSGADLTGLLFIGMTADVFGEADFRKALLDKTRWSGVIPSIDFTEASLREAVFQGGCMGTVFRGANLTGANINIIIGGDLTEANLTDAHFTIYEYTSASFTAADLSGMRVYLDKSVNFGRPDSLNHARLRFTAGLSDKQRRQIVWDEANSAKNSRCFIAAAACGTDSDEVIVLRRFRDTVLGRTGAGRACIAFYERISPPVARMISKSSVARELTRLVIVRPLASLVKIARGVSGINSETERE
jgi:hypothetical protein